MTTTYVVSFDRIGRTHEVPDLPVEVDDNEAHAQQIAEAVHRFARRRLEDRPDQLDLFDWGGCGCMTDGAAS